MLKSENMIEYDDKGRLLLEVQSPNYVIKTTYIYHGYIKSIDEKSHTISVGHYYYEHARHLTNPNYENLMSDRVEKFDNKFIL